MGFASWRTGGFWLPDGRQGRAWLRLMYVLQSLQLHLRLHHHGVHLPSQLMSGAPLYHACLAFFQVPWTPVMYPLRCLASVCFLLQKCPLVVKPGSTGAHNETQNDTASLYERRSAIHSGAGHAQAHVCMVRMYHMSGALQVETPFLPPRTACAHTGQGCTHRVSSQTSMQFCAVSQNPPLVSTRNLPSRRHCGQANDIEGHTLLAKENPPPIHIQLADTVIKPVQGVPWPALCQLSLGSINSNTVKIMPEV